MDGWECHRQDITLYYHLYFHLPSSLRILHCIRSPRAICITGQCALLDRPTTTYFKSFSSYIGFLGKKMLRRRDRKGMGVDRAYICAIHR